MNRLAARFVLDESAATAVEYALVAALVCVSLILGATAIGTKLNTVFNGLSTNINSPS